MKSDSGYKVIQPSDPLTLEEVPAGTSFSISPSVGATVTGQYSLSGLGNFIPCEFGAITQQLVTTIDGSCFYLKFTVSGGSATIEWSAEK